MQHHGAVNDAPACARHEVYCAVIKVVMRAKRRHLRSFVWGVETARLGIMQAEHQRILGYKEGNSQVSKGRVEDEDGTSDVVLCACTWTEN